MVSLENPYLRKVPSSVQWTMITTPGGITALVGSREPGGTVPVITPTSMDSISRENMRVLEMV